ncbi:hypothetical protein WMW71_12345 [Flavobacterium buctense]|uniref:Transcriptional regulator n=1 Tax=Flavobacterium buctense TaxID=1648146 RepID=A0ABU9E3A0_9FLAO|nr:hypothetical protein [Flavobacterium buctense]
MFTAEHKILNLTDFKNEQGHPLPGGKMLAEIMRQKELIKPCSEEEVSYKLTELGQYIAESGGWLNHVEKIKGVKKNTPKEFKKPKNEVKRLNLELILAGIIIAFLCMLIVSCI